MASTKNRIHQAFGLSAAHHGREDPISANGTTNLQVINFGLSRTGTTSTCAALEILGFGPAHQGIDMFRSPQRNARVRSLVHDIRTGVAGPPGAPALTTRIRSLMSGYRSTSDHPFNFMPEAMLAAYPDAKSILGVRDGGAKAWWTSFDNTGGLHFRRDWKYALFRALVYPVSFLRNTDNLIQEERLLMMQLYGPVGPDLYDRHYEAVVRAIPSDRLLVFQAKQGWRPLCDFLGVPVPDRPFPMINEAESTRAIYFGMQAYGACVWALYAGIAASAAWLVARPDSVRVLLEKMWACVGDLT